MPPKSPPLPRKLRIGVLMEEIQAADIMGIDIFTSLCKAPSDITAYLSTLGPALDEHSATAARYKDHMLDIEWFFIAATLDPTPFYMAFRWVPNVTYQDCPRDLDIVIQGGNWPNCRPVEADRFMREAFPKTRYWLTTCIGSLWLASSGALNGKQATTNRVFLPLAKSLHPDVDWVDRRWVVQEKPYVGGDAPNGEVWTAAGAVAGLDMVASFCLEKFDPEFVRNVAFESLDYGRT